MRREERVGDKSKQMLCMDIVWLSGGYGGGVKS